MGGVAEGSRSKGRGKGGAKGSGVEWGGSKCLPKEKDEMTVNFLHGVSSLLR